MIYQRPLKGQWVVITHHGDKIWYGTHKGLDLRATVGTPVFSPVNGVVKDKRETPNANAFNGGNHLYISHDKGFLTRLFHLNDSLVKVGDKVTVGQHIANSGNNGKLCRGEHLHIDLSKNGTYIDPEPIITPFESNNILNQIGMTKDELMKELDKRYAKKDIRINFDPSDGSVWAINHKKRYKIQNADDVAILASMMAGENISDEERNYPITTDRNEVLKK